MPGLLYDAPITATGALLPGQPVMPDLDAGLLYHWTVEDLTRTTVYRPSEWVDRVSGLVLSNPNSGNRPRMEPASLGGTGALEFDGSATPRWLRTTSATAPVIPVGTTYALAYYRRNPAGQMRVTSARNTDNYHTFGTTASSGIGMMVGNTSRGAFYSETLRNQWAAAVAVVGETQTRLYVDDVPEIVGGSADINNIGITVGASALSDPATGTNHFDGYIADYRVYRREFSANDARGLIQALRERYGFA